jgi:hypothetical protein
MGELLGFAKIYGRGDFTGKARAADSDTVQASGPPEKGNAPVLFWLALVALMIGVRLLYEKAE